MATVVCFDSPQPTETVLAIGIKCGECDALRFRDASLILEALNARAVGGIEIAVVCEACGKRIDVALGWTGDVGEGHGYNVPTFLHNRERIVTKTTDKLGLKKPELKLLCDFCAQERPIVATYDCEPFVLPDTQQGSQGSWAACAVCEPMVDRADWQALGVAHDAVCSCVTSQPAAEQIKIRAIQNTIWSMFQKNRGVKRRVIPSPKEKN